MVDERGSCCRQLSPSQHFNCLLPVAYENLEALQEAPGRLLWLGLDCPQLVEQPEGTWCLGIVKDQGRHELLDLPSEGRLSVLARQKDFIVVRTEEAQELTSSPLRPALVHLVPAQIQPSAARQHHQHSAPKP